VIYVDQLRHGGAPWSGGFSCHMVSDVGEDELLSFASLLGLPRAWFQGCPPASIPHFDLSPRLRTRALELGAVEVDRSGLVAAVRRLRATNPHLVR
jgi:hypothetical protein